MSHICVQCGEEYVSDVCPRCQLPAGASADPWSEFFRSAHRDPAVIGLITACSRQPDDLVAYAALADAVDEGHSGLTLNYETIPSSLVRPRHAAAVTGADFAWALRWCAAAGKWPFLLAADNLGVVHGDGGEYARNIAPRVRESLQAGGNPVWVWGAVGWDQLPETCVAPWFKHTDLAQDDQWSSSYAGHETWYEAVAYAALVSSMARKAWNIAHAEPLPGDPP